MQRFQVINSLLFAFYIILNTVSCVWVTIDRVWIGDWIYWSLTHHEYNYNATANLHTLQITTAHANPSQSAFTSHFPVTDLTNGDFSAYVLTSLLCGEYSTTELSLSLSLMLWQTVSWPAYLGIKHPSGAYDQIFITVRQMQVCWCGVLWLEDGSVVYNCCWPSPAQSF
jgi:hypothetical protein